MIQSVRSNDKPVFLCLEGGRGGYREYVWCKEGRHAPSDEWVMHLEPSGEYSFRSNDPFYPDFYLNYAGPDYSRRLYEFKAYNLKLVEGKCPYGDDLWTIADSGKGFVTIKAEVRPGREGSGRFIYQVPFKDGRNLGLVMEYPRSEPAWGQRNRFRIIDVTPSNTER
ncbi:MAG: hypothetical protein KDA68_01060 [Planctomycetaceae bacterium]|nr:hypothetical protein [Planctomycetaceae bacterium]